MSKNLKIILIIIFLLAFALRFWQLGQNPPSLDWDEASLGYNAYSLFKTGADEYGNKWPLAIRSFGDYKPPFYTYLTIPSVAIFGLNEFAVRFPSALFGFLTVVVVYFLSKELFPKLNTNYYLLTTFLLAISPWHLQFSRVAFEANLGLFWFILGTYLFLKGTKSGRFLAFSAIAFVLAFYSYHSVRLVAPVFLLGLAVYFRKELWLQKKWAVVAAILGFTLSLPLVRVFQTGAGESRFSSVTVLTPTGTLDRSISQLEEDQKRGDFVGQILHNRRIVYTLTVIQGYLDHWDLNFLFLRGDAPGRHHAKDIGMLYFWDLPFVLFGIYFLIKNRPQNTFVVFWWFLTAPLASALTTGTPHAVRALLYLPSFQIFAAYGFWEVVKNRGKIISITLFSLLIIIFFYYLHMYYKHTPLEYSQWWQYGYRQVVEEVAKREKDYQKILVTYRYDQPYIYFLFYQKIDPLWYQKNWGGGEVKRMERSFGKYEFRNLEWSMDQNLKNTLLVGTPDEIPANTLGLLKEIKFLDGQVAFRIVGR